MLYTHRNRVIDLGRTEAAVDREQLVPQPKGRQLCGCTRGLAKSAPIRAGNQDDRCPRLISQTCKRRPEAHLLHLQAGMWPQTGCAPVVSFQETRPGLR